MGIKQQEDELVNFRRQRKLAGAGVSKDVTKLKKDIKILKKNDVKNYKIKHIPPASLSASITQATPVVYCLNNISQGTDETNRIGSKVRMVHLEMNMHIFRYVNTQQPACMVRVLLVREISTLGSLLALNQLFSSATPPPHDVRNLITRDNRRFKILSDKTFSLGPRVVSISVAEHMSGATSSTKIIKWNKKLNFVTNYARGNAGTVADIDTNALHVIVLTDNGTANDLACEIACNLTIDDN